MPNKNCRIVYRHGNDDNLIDRKNNCQEVLTVLSVAVYGLSACIKGPKFFPPVFWKVISFVSLKQLPVLLPSI